MKKTYFLRNLPDFDRLNKVEIFNLVNKHRRCGKHILTKKKFSISMLKEDYENNDEVRKWRKIILIESDQHIYLKSYFSLVEV